MAIRLRILVDADICVGPVLTVAESVNHPQIRHGEILVELETQELGRISIQGVPIKLSESSGAVPRRRRRLVKPMRNYFYSLGTQLRTSKNW